MSLRSRRFAAVLVSGALLAAAVPATASAVSTITISGATGSAPLVALLAKKYVKLKPGKVKFKLAQGGGEVGIQDAAAGRVTIGNAARDPRPSDPAGLVFYPIAKDFFCFDTNPANPLPNLTKAQAIAIWTGAVRDWSEVPGSTVTGPIDLIGRTSASSLPPLVQSLLLGDKTISSLAALKPSDGLVAAVGRLGQERDRLQLRLVRARRRTCTRSPTRASAATCRARSPASTRACATTTR